MDAGEFNNMTAKHLEKVIKWLHSDARQTLEARDHCKKMYVGWANRLVNVLVILSISQKHDVHLVRPTG